MFIDLNYVTQRLNSLSNRKLSFVGRDILKLIPNLRTNIDCGNSVISAVHNDPKSMKRKRRQNQFASSLCGVSSTGASTATDYNIEDHKKIDRILYNLYGDIVSIMRKVKVYYETHPCDDYELTVRRTQNESIRHFIGEFVKQQPEDLIEAISKLKITSNSSDGDVSEGMVNSIVETSENSIAEHRTGPSTVYPYPQPAQRTNKTNKPSMPEEEKRTSTIQQFEAIASDNSKSKSRKKFHFDVDQLFSPQASKNNEQSPVSNEFHGFKEFDDNNVEYERHLYQRNVPIQYRATTNERAQRSENTTNERAHRSKNTSERTHQSKNTMKEASAQRKNIDPMGSGHSKQSQQSKFHFDLDELYSKSSKTKANNRRIDEFADFDDNMDLEGSNHSFFLDEDRTPKNSQLSKTSQLIFTGSSEHDFDKQLTPLHSNFNTQYNDFTLLSNSAANQMLSPDESPIFRNINQNISSVIQNLNSHQNTQRSYRTSTPINEIIEFSNRSNQSIRPNLQRLKSLSNASQFSNASQRSMPGT